MQKVRTALPAMLPLFFLNTEDAVNTKPAKVKVLQPENDKTFKIEFKTPTGRVKVFTAKFLSKKHNCIISDRWIVKGRTTYVPHSSKIKILSQD
jgi:hypothetical protein